MEEWGQIAPSRTEQEEAEAVQKNQPGKASAATVGQGSRVLAAAPRLRYPPFPRTCKLKDIRNWEKECNRIKKILEKGLLLNFAMPIFVFNFATHQSSEILQIGQSLQLLEVRVRNLGWGFTVLVVGSTCAGAHNLRLKQGNQWCC